MSGAATASPRHLAVIGACQGCGACLLTCPEHAIRPRGAVLTVRPERCTGCGECVEVCPVDAIDLAERGESARNEGEADVRC